MPAIFTNKQNLPKSFVDAILVNDHIVNGDISVTQLIDAPQIRQLKRTHDYEVDVMDLIGMALGTGVHTVLERGDLQGSVDAKILQQASGVLVSLGEDKAAEWMKGLVEKKLKVKIDGDIITERNLTMEVEGWEISGTMDRYNQKTHILQDYKTTSASSMMFPETKKSYNDQLNIYAALLRENGFEVKGAQIIAILKDWSALKTKQSKDYPKHPVVVMDIKLHDHDLVMNYITKRVILHQRAEAGEHIPCTKKERWAKADTFAVKKKGGKKALRVFPKEIMAKGFVEGNAHKYNEGELIIEHRPSESFRCSNGYCPVSSICPQYQAEVKAATEAADNL